MLWPAVVWAAAAAVWLRYALGATFLYDDWAYVANATFHLGETQSYRPGFSVVTGAMTSLFGTHQLRYYLAVDLIAATVPAALYVALRRLRVGTVTALIAAALMVVMPRSDSLHLWWTASPIAVALTLGLLGVAAGGRFVDGGRRAMAWLAASLGLVAAAVLTYESTAVLILLGPALIAFSVRRRRTLVLSALHVAVVIPAAWLMYTRTNPGNVANGTPAGQWPSRLGSLLVDAWRIFFTDLPGQIGVAGLVSGLLVAAAAAAAAVLLGRRVDQGTGARQRIVTSAVSAALLLAAGFAAFVPFIPANGYYAPSAPGVGNRVNAAAAIFFASAAALVAGRLVELGAERRRGAAPLLAAAGAGLAATLLAVGTRESLADATEFSSAARLRDQTLASTQSALQSAPPGSVLLLGDYARYRGDQLVPILAESWYTQGAIQIRYHDPSLQAAPVDPTNLCTATGIALAPGGTPVPYPRVHVIDVGRAAAVPIGDQASCRSLLPQQVAVFIDARL
ncbi:MAG: glycosyltransferase family 39 protein [Chloroflexi bacterium]|nr:MAG: glycosyltransferase family 39 protein [Chloroflexota bacterium]